MSQPRITYDGVPVVITGEHVYGRHQGTDRHAADEKTKLASSKNFRYKCFLTYLNVENEGT